ncbi:MAG: LysM peptidoglycan-binding domain-containing protein [Verrucomicrobia bacterium]|nr:MAG: LysM peptidoglycan-binding domain-containing protein [Verrucomicrobiota bacterium]
MRPVFHALSILAILLSLNACRTTTGKQEPNVGPYDSHGRYVEAWADDPSKWRPYTPKDVEGDPPRIAKNEQPLDNSVPLAAGNAPTTRAKPPRNGADSTSQLSRNSKSKAKTDTEPTAKKSSKSKTDTEPTAKKSSKSKTDTEPTAKKSSKSKTASEPTATTSSKSKSSAAHSPPKTKSSSGRHTVKPGDSLYTIAAKYGTSVSALKEANGISGSIIRDGKVLVIPARK